MTERTDVLVVGGGLAGLTAAATAARAGARTILLERAEPGGRASTDSKSAPDGRRFLFNRGAHALYQAEGLEVLRRLGIDPTGSPPAVGKGKVRYRGELHTFPSNARTMTSTSLLGVRGKARLGALLARIHKLDPADLTGFTAADWIANLDLPEAADAFVRTIVRTGTYSIAFDLLDAGAALAQVRGAVKGVLYLDGGFQQLVDGLARVARRAGVDIRTGGATVAEGGVAGDQAQPCARLSSGEIIVADSIVIAAGPPESAGALLDGGPPAPWRETAGPPVTASCLALGLDRPAVIPLLFDMEDPLYLSTHSGQGMDTGLAPDGGVVVETLRYHAPHEEPESATTKAELHSLARQAGIAKETIVTERYLHRMVVSGGLPLAERDGLAGRPPITVPGHPGVLVTGDWVGPTGMLADAALSSGEAAGVAAATRMRTHVARV